MYFFIAHLNITTIKKKLNKILNHLWCHQKMSYQVGFNKKCCVHLGREILYHPRDCSSSAASGLGDNFSLGLDIQITIKANVKMPY
jgi:hypothetical protein